jgi:glycosyltransferase involved in cell wall biosynthesis
MSPLWPDALYRAIMADPFPKKLTRVFLICGIPYTFIRIPTILQFKVISFNGFGIPRDKWAISERCAKFLGKKYVYHYQDNHLEAPFLREGALRRIGLADALIVPTEPLRQSILKVAPKKAVYVLEEGIDVDRFHPTAHGSSTEKIPTVVWGGNPRNLKEVPFLFDILRKLQGRLAFQFRVITGTSRPDLDLDFEWFPYSPKTEASLLAGACAGLAPLADSPYARGKGGYKVKTYLAAGVPPVASPISHHINMVRDGANGFLPKTEQEWEAALTNLIQDRNLAARLGLQAREDAVAKYSYSAVAPAWVNAFKDILKER